jgi:hypothetical protein
LGEHVAKLLMPEFTPEQAHRRSFAESPKWRGPVLKPQSDPVW